MIAVRLAPSAAADLVRFVQAKKSLAVDKLPEIATRFIYEHYK
jgi:hypothetical protein